jgi:hypothetical protein
VVVATCSVVAQPPRVMATIAMLPVRITEQG